MEGIKKMILRYKMKRQIKKLEKEKESLSWIIGVEKNNNPKAAERYEQVCKSITSLKIFMP